MQISILIFLILTFLTTLLGAWLGYFEHNPWKIGDWLINYQGGIVRRGLVGEVIYQMSLWTNVNPGIIAVLLQILCYAFFFYFSYKLLLKQRSLKPYLLLIFSPFIFTFQIYDLQGGFRKEILYFALLSFVVYLSYLLDLKLFNKIFYGILLCYPVLILSHEMLAFFLPYILIIYVHKNKVKKKDWQRLFYYLLPSIICFFVAIHYSGNQSQVDAIFDSLSSQNYGIKAGNSAISWLSRTSKDGISHVLAMINNNQYLVTYPILLAFAIVAYIPIRRKIFLIFKDKNALIILGVSIFGSLALFCVAWDWGRFIYIHLVSLFLISLVKLEQNSESLDKQNFMIRKKRFVPLLINFFLVIYSQFWYLPHFNSSRLSPFSRHKFRYPNIRAYVLIIEKSWFTYRSRD